MLDIARASEHEDVQTWGQRYGNLTDACEASLSFKLDDAEKHVSATCRVLNALTVHDSVGTDDDMTVAKFMDVEEQFKREKECREHLLGSADRQHDAIEAQGHDERLIEDCIVVVHHAFEVDQESHMWQGLVKANPRLNKYGKFVLIMPRGLRDLMDVLAHDRIAGHDEPKAAHYVPVRHGAAALHPRRC